VLTLIDMKSLAIRFHLSIDKHESLVTEAVFTFLFR
jgi:hypothetical protein